MYKFGKEKPNKMFVTYRHNTVRNAMMMGRK
jgi:hypothetical protein